MTVLQQFITGCKRFLLYSVLLGSVVFFTANVSAEQHPIFSDSWGSFGDADDQFQYPYSVYVGADDYLYVSDWANHRVKIMTPYGEIVTMWGSEGSGDGQFRHPSGITADDSSRVYVVDSVNHRIQKFWSDGVFITKWGGQGFGDGQFQRPRGIAIDDSNNVYISDSHNHRIQKFTSAGIFIKNGVVGAVVMQN